MQTIHTYLKDYGKYTFLEKEFNEVDNVILSLISYVDLDGIVPERNQGKITLQKASEIFFQKYSKKEIDSNIWSVKHACYLLQELSETNRFQNLLLYNYEYKVTFDMQFGALCILLPNKSIYVSYEGTDGYVSGWKEDFMLCYQFPTSAQLEAVQYLNRVIGFFSPKVYVGGHSKGGNLALVSAMFCKPRIRHKIKYVFCNDGPGLRKKEFESKEYQKILPKLKYFVPKESLIGMLLRHQDNYMVVDSTYKKLLQHDALSWIVEDDHFRKTKISAFSQKIEKGISNWLDKRNDKQRKDFVDNLFNIFNKAQIRDFTEFKKSKLEGTIKIIKEAKNMDKETRNMLLTCFKELIEEMK